jgi:HEAT repeat protein
MTTDEIQRLLDILEAYEVLPDLLESGLDAFSDEAKNAVVERLARAPEPPPGQVVARLLFIRTPQNEADMAAVFRRGLQSPDPAARKFSLYGLDQLDHPAATDAALEALADDDDWVTFAAATILLPKAAQEPGIAEALRDAYAAKKGKEEFHATVSLLEARLIEPGEPT